MRDHGEHSESRSEESSSGITHLAAGAVGLFLDYFHTRLELFGIELREARRSLIIGTFLLIAAAALLFVAWLGCCIVLVAKISESTSLDWVDVTLYLAIAHIAFALAGLLAGRRLLSSSYFRDSLKEFENDRRWLERYRKHSRRDDH